jgi:hypothetical protein
LFRFPFGWWPSSRRYPNNFFAADGINFVWPDSRGVGGVLPRTGLAISQEQKSLYPVDTGLTTE